jgi:hypothetical protein
MKLQNEEKKVQEMVPERDMRETDSKRKRKYER